MILTRLSLNQLNRISEISGNLGILFFATLVIPYFFAIDRPSLPVVILGLILTFGFWLFSIVLVKE